MKTVILLLSLVSPAALLATEKITADYDEAVKTCHVQKKRLPTIRELQHLWAKKLLSPHHSYWSTTCAIERPNRSGWDYKNGDCATFWKPDFKYRFVMILDGQGKAKPEDLNSPEVKIAYCVSR